MPCSRARALRVLLLSVAVIGLCGGQASALLILEDGGTHVINSPSQPVWVQDSLAGGTTRLTVIDHALIGAEPVTDRSIRAAGHHGGRGIVTIADAWTLGYIEASCASCVTITDGTFGVSPDEISVYAHSLSKPAVVAIQGGTFAGTVWAEDDSRVHITGGAIGKNTSYGNSLIVMGPLGSPSVDVNGATLDGGVRVHGDSYVGVSNSTVGRTNQFISAYTNAPFGSTAVMGITGSVLERTVLVGPRSEVSVSNSTVGSGIGPVYGRSILVETAHYSANAVADIATGDYPGGLGAHSGARVRIARGAFGPGGGASIPTSLFVGTPEGEDLYAPAIAQVFGGTYTHPIYAGRHGRIHLYGHGLAYDPGSGLLTGTFASGEPTNIPLYAHPSGKFFYHEVAATRAIAPGYMVMQTQSPSVNTFWLPPDLVPPPEDCPFGAIPVAMAAVPLGVMTLGGRSVDLGGANVVIQRMDEAAIPGPDTFEDTIPIELVALQLQSTEPIDLTPLGGRGVDYMFLTLQANGGPLRDPSTGQMTIDFAMHTFDSFFDVFFDVREGSPDGPILFSASDTLVAVDIPWGTEVNPGEGGVPITVDLADLFTAGVVGGELKLSAMNGQFLQLRMRAALIPEPGTLTLVALGALGLLRRRRSSRRRPADTD